VAVGESNGTGAAQEQRYGRREFLQWMASSTAGLALTAAGCGSGAESQFKPPADLSSSVPRRVMNYLAVGVSDFAQSIDFYSKTLGIKIFEQSGEWAEPVNGWHDYQTMVWEVLGAAPPAPAARRWGSGCNLRPVLFVDDPDAVVATLAGKGVEFAGDFVDEGWRRVIEFQDPDRIPWALGQAAGFPKSPSLEVPCVCGIDIKAADLEAQVAFYSEVMGMTVARREPQILLVQDGGKAFLTLQPGGRRIESESLDATSSGLTVDSPLYLSWMVDDLDDAVARVTDLGAPALKGITAHEFGRVFVTADPDGNLLKLVHYNRSHSPD